MEQLEKGISARQESGHQKRRPHGQHGTARIVHGPCARLLAKATAMNAIKACIEFFEAAVRLPARRALVPWERSMHPGGHSVLAPLVGNQPVRRRAPHG